MATGDTASDPFWHEAFPTRGWAASGCGDRHHAGLLRQGDGTLRSSPGSQRSAFRSNRRSANAGDAEGDA
jgi:hypothetical protein